MDIKTLEKHFKVLASLEETSSPFLSCYINNSDLNKGYREDLNERINELRRVLPPRQISSFEKSLGELEAALSSETSLKSKGVAIFCRSGKFPFFEVLHFDIPFETELTVDYIPHLYQLVLMKDTYFRYVVLITEESHARIVEVSVGRITREVWAESPEINEKSGRSWTKQHYQNHRRDRSKKFLKEKIKVLEKLFREGEHAHLIIAGNRQNCARVKQRLPKHLQEKLLDDRVLIGGNYSTKDIITASLSVFAKYEQYESVNKAVVLKELIQTGGLAVSGTRATLDALLNGQVDTLVMSDSYIPPESWKCNDCNFIEIKERTNACYMCGSTSKTKINIKEEIIRLAEQMSVTVEILRDSDELLDVNGIGCLLRFKY